MCFLSLHIPKCIYNFEHGLRSHVQTVILSSQFIVNTQSYTYKLYTYIYIYVQGVTGKAYMAYNDGFFGQFGDDFSLAKMLKSQ